MSTIVGIVVVVLVVIGALLAYAATRPSEFRIERSATVSAPPDTVFAVINDLHQWSLWSPFEKYDPNTKKTYEGPRSGPGASYAWNGNDKAGEGRMTILESKPCERVTIKLEFTRPFTATNQVNFVLAPADGGTRVSWIMDGKNNFMMKVMCIFMNMDKMVGKDFEEGLANLGRLSQSEARTLA